MRGAETNQGLEVRDEAVEEVARAPNRGYVAPNEIEKEFRDLRLCLPPCILGSRIQEQHLGQYLTPLLAIQTEAILYPTTVLEEAPHLTHREGWLGLSHSFGERFDIFAAHVLLPEKAILVEVAVRQVTGPNISDSPARPLLITRPVTAAIVVFPLVSESIHASFSGISLRVAKSA
ncbi:MAG TPA: hypothetical protein VNZ57_15850 [Longimicrobiales bacterium]|nr:hypothetical protein [Longimicrobiales bacterium]